MSDKGGGWRAKVMGGLVLILVVAVVTRVAWELLVPTLPIIAVLLALGAIYWLIFSRGRH